MPSTRGIIGAIVGGNDEGAVYAILHLLASHVTLVTGYCCASCNT